MKAAAQIGTRAALLLVLTASLAGCAGLSLLTGGGSEPAPTTYDLRAAPAERSLGRAGGQIGIREPRAIQVLDSDRIVFRPSATMVAYYAGAQWSDRLPKLIEERLLAAFETSSNLKTVSRTTDALAVDYYLLTDIRDFSISETPKLAHIQIYVKLVVDNRGRAISGQSFEAQVPVLGQGAEGAVGALDAALSDVLSQIVRWTLKQV